MSYLYISWQQFHRDTHTLAQICKEKGPFERLIVIARGGLAPAAILAQALDIRIVDTICVASYSHSNTREDLVLIKDSLHGGQTTLVVDDLADSGKTAAFVRERLPNAHMAALYAKPEGEASLDSYVHKVAQDKWIVFPWEEAPEIAAQWPAVASL
ncbi:MAG: xanthine phosphoribosyltransferase [Candidatus Puniceispirillum sp.]|nr:xanthine phosphoribosyltransferase [Candidatus Puniceispirillum sp.]